MSVADWAQQDVDAASPRGDVSAWLDGIDGARQQAAYQRLAAMPPAPGRPHHVEHPFGWVDRSFIKEQFPREVVHCAIDLSPVVPCPLEHLVGIQHTVTPRTVAQYIEQGALTPEGTRDPDHGGLIDHPIVLRCDGVNAIWDGHNRLTAAYLLGAGSWPCRFVDLDDPDLVLRAQQAAAASGEHGEDWGGDEEGAQEHA